MSFVPTDSQLRKVACHTIETRAAVSFDEAWCVVSDAFEGQPMTIQQLDYAAAQVRWLIEQAEITLPGG